MGKSRFVRKLVTHFILLSLSQLLGHVRGTRSLYKCTSISDFPADTTRSCSATYLAVLFRLLFRLLCSDALQAPRATKVLEQAALGRSVLNFIIGISRELDTTTVNECGR